MGDMVNGERVKAVIFDLDGTLLDTLEDLADAVNAALRSGNLPGRTLDEVRNFVGNGIVNLMRRAVPDAAACPAFDGLMRTFRAFYSEHCRDKTAPYPGITEMLCRLKENHVKMAVVSNKADFAVRELVAFYFDGLIEVAHGEDEAAGIRKKPAADMVWRALEELGCTAGQAVYVGDSDVDLKTAANAGMDCVSVSWGFRGREFLEEQGAAFIIDHPRELAEMI